MKTVKFLMFLVFCALSQSCVRYVDEETGRPLAGPYNPYPAQNGGYAAGTQQEGRKVVGQKKIAHNHTVKPFVSIRGQAPADVCQSVSEATANEVSLIAQKSVQPGQKPKWPSHNDVERIAGENFARLGYNLNLGQEGQPGCYRVVKYSTGM